MADEYWGYQSFNHVPYTGDFTRSSHYGNSAISPGSTSQSVGDTTSQSLTVKNDRLSTASVKILCVWDVAGDSSWDEQASTGYVSIPSGGTNTFTCNHLVGSGMAGKTYKIGYEVITDLTSAGGGQWVTDSYWTTAKLTVASTTTSAPGAPPSLTATVRSSTNIFLDWETPASNGGATITRYNLYRATSPGAYPSTPTATMDQSWTSYDNTAGLSPSTTYYYKITAVNSAGEGSGSEVSARTNDPPDTSDPSPTPPTVSWTTKPPTSITSGGAFTVGWSASGSYDTVNIHWDPSYVGDGCCTANTLTSGSTNWLSGNSHMLTAPTVNSPTTIKYVVHLHGSHSAYSTMETVTVNPTTTEPTEPPTGPINLTNDSPDCTTGYPGVRLDWNAASGANVVYDLYRDGSLSSARTGLTGTTFYNGYSGGGVKAESTYGYKVTARNSGGSIDSNTQSVWISSDICNPPPVSPAPEPTGPAPPVGMTSCNDHGAVWVCLPTSSSNGKRVVISPGHQPGSPNTFACGAYAGQTSEYAEAWKTTYALSDKLRQSGFESIVPKQPMNGAPLVTTTEFYGPRLAAASELNANAYVAIHSNAGSGGCGAAPGGTQLLWLNEQDQAIGQSVFDALKGITPGTSNEKLCDESTAPICTNVNSWPPFELNDPRAKLIPTAYIELEFHSTTQGADWIVAHHDETAEAILQGLVSYFESAAVAQPAEPPRPSAPEIMIEGASQLHLPSPGLVVIAFICSDVDGDLAGYSILSGQSGKAADYWSFPAMEARHESWVRVEDTGESIVQARCGDKLGHESAPVEWRVVVGTLRPEVSANFEQDPNDPSHGYVTITQRFTSQGVEVGEPEQEEFEVVFVTFGTTNKPGEPPYRDPRFYSVVDYSTNLGVVLGDCIYDQAIGKYIKNLGPELIQTGMEHAAAELLKTGGFVVSAKMLGPALFVGETPYCTVNGYEIPLPLEGAWMVVGQPASIRVRYDTDGLAGSDKAYVEGWEGTWRDTTTASSRSIFVKASAPKAAFVELAAEHFGLPVIFGPAHDRLQADFQSRTQVRASGPDSVEGTMTVESRDDETVSGMETKITCHAPDGITLQFKPDVHTTRIPNPTAIVVDVDGRQLKQAEDLDDLADRASKENHEYFVITNPFSGNGIDSPLIIFVTLRECSTHSIQIAFQEEGNSVILTPSEGISDAGAGPAHAPTHDDTEHHNFPVPTITPVAFLAALLLAARLKKRT